MKNMFSTAEAASILKVSSPATVRQAILRGALKAEKIGRDWFIKKDDLNDYISRPSPRPKNRTAPME